MKGRSQPSAGWWRVVHIAGTCLLVLWWLQTVALLWPALTLVFWILVCVPLGLVALALLFTASVAADPGTWRARERRLARDQDQTPLLAPDWQSWQWYLRLRGRAPAESRPERASGRLDS